MAAQLDGKSTDKVERLATRRARVKSKLEQAKRNALGINICTPVEEQPNPEQNRTSTKQASKSYQRVEKLIGDSNQLVSNVSVAINAREVSRRQEHDELRKARYEKLEADTNAGDERFEEIARKWKQYDEKTSVPQDIQNMLQQQKTACNSMIQEKDKLIVEFEEELKSKDEQYVKQLKKQAEDVDLLVERMEEQARTVVKTFCEELNQIDATFSMERQELQRNQQQEHNEYMHRRMTEEGNHLRIREERLEENQTKLKKLRLKYAGELNQIKIKLESEIQHLQQQIQQMKATFQLNAEKLEYNFQVLKKRDEENTVTISQQKRKITRLQDTCNILRTKLTKQEATYKSELASLLLEYRKNVDQFRELQKKVQHFQLVDAKRFYDIWRMNEKKAKALVESISNVDEIIHRQQLGIEWTPPSVVNSPIQFLLTRVDHNASQATMYASQVFSESESPAAIADAPSVLQPCIKQILHIIATECSFLLESKLTQLLAPLQKEEQMLMKLDSVFKALKIETESDVLDLASFFVKQVPATDDSSTANPTRIQSSSINESPSSTSIMSTSQALKTGIHLIHPNEVPNALKRFAESRKAKSGSLYSSGHPKVPDLKDNTPTDILDGVYWMKMSDILSSSHKKIWSSIIDGLEKYYLVLIKRAKQIEEKNSLKQQNAELRLLLHQYMHSRINHELEVPPTLMMPSTMTTTVL